jgi:hypothetical protein
MTITTTQLHETTQAVVSYILWDEGNWKDLLQTSLAAYSGDGDAFMKEWAERDNSTSPFNGHIVTDALFLYEQVFGDKAEDFVLMQARENGFSFVADED